MQSCKNSSRPRPQATDAKTLSIEPGSSWENGSCESFSRASSDRSSSLRWNSKLCNEFLKDEIFHSLKEVRVLAKRWRVSFNSERPHSSLGYKPPAPAEWQTEASQRHGKEESKQRFPLSHTACYCHGRISASSAALHEQSHWCIIPGRPRCRINPQCSQALAANCIPRVRCVDSPIRDYNQDSA